MFVVVFKLNIHICSGVSSSRQSNALHKWLNCSIRREWSKTMEWFQKVGPINIIFKIYRNFGRAMELTTSNSYEISINSYLHFSPNDYYHMRLAIRQIFDVDRINKKVSIRIFLKLALTQEAFTLAIEFRLSWTIQNVNFLFNFFKSGKKMKVSKNVSNICIGFDFWRIWQVPLWAEISLFVILYSAVLMFLCHKICDGFMLFSKLNYIELKTRLISALFRLEI